MLTHQQALAFLKIAIAHWDGNKTVHEFARKEALEVIIKDIKKFDPKIKSQTIEELSMTHPALIERMDQLKSLSLVICYLEALKGGKI
jgi:hypothetical protein